MLSQEAKGFLLEHPEMFLLHYFPERIQVLKDFHVELIEQTQRRRGLELYPATHGKTTITSELMPIYEIARNPNIRIAGLFKNDQDARAITRSIQTELVTNEGLIEDFGPFYTGQTEGKLWTQNRFDIAHRTRVGKSSTWAAFGAGSRDALGYRTDWTLCDDVVTDKNSSTDVQRENFRQWYMQGPMTMPDKEEGRITVVGTAFDPRDLYHDLMAVTKPDSDDPLWHSIVRRAIIDEDTQEVLWPDERPYGFLMEQKGNMGTLDFNKRFQNVARDASQLTFREEYVRGGVLLGERFPGCIDVRYSIGDRDPSWDVIIGFDPAIGVYRSSKFCAMIVLGVGSCKHHERCWWLIDIKRDQMTLPQQVEMLVAYGQRYKSKDIRVEINAYQAGLLQRLKEVMDERNIFLPVNPHHTSKVNKPDPEIGIPGMSQMVQQGKLHIPWADAASRKAMTILIDEMIMYPGKTTDTVMALWFAWLASTGQAPRFKPHNRLTASREYSWPKPNVFGMQTYKNPYYAKDD